jgi:hypothetical protein
VDAVCFQMVPGILRHDHAPEIASSDHKDVGLAARIGARSPTARL